MFLLETVMYCSDVGKSIRMCLATCCTIVLLTTAVIAQEGMGREEVISALRKSVAALRTIDRPDEARRMANILEDYLNSDRKKRAERERDPSPREQPMSEREIGIEHVKHMRMALEGLMAAKKIDAAESLEKAIHAREMRLEGKRDEKSQRIIADSPSREAQIELLMFSARFLKEQGKTEKAQVVQSLAENLRRPQDSNRRRENADLERRNADRERANISRPRRDRESAERERAGADRDRREADRARENLGGQRRNRETDLEPASAQDVAKHREIDRAKISEMMEMNQKLIAEMRAQMEKIDRENRARIEQLSRFNEEMGQLLKSMNRAPKTQGN